MKAAFGAEAIGLGLGDPQTAALLQAIPQVADALGVQMRRGKPVDPLNPRPWVAEITGTHPTWRWDRKFLPARVDYTHANSRATRGVWFWWTLESGHVYEARYRTSWASGQHRRYITVDDIGGDIIDLSEEEVTAWLSDCSASTS